MPALTRANQYPPRKHTDEQILAAIVTLTSEQGFPPSVRELATRVGYHSQSSVHRHLKRLEREGRVSWGHPGASYVEKRRLLRVVE